MDSFFSELKAARELRGISLAEISDATLISIKMLEAVEHGNIHVVPQPYIRAFIREYAGVVGIDPTETMKKYDAWLASKEPSKQQRDITQTPSSENKDLETKPSRSDKVEQLVPLFFKVGVAIVVLVLADIVLWSVLEKEPLPRVKEMPFQVMVRENEERAGLVDTTEQPRAEVAADTIGTKKTGITMPTVVVDRESLTLVAATTDSVWLQIVIDQRKMSEHFLYPNTTFKWKAKNEFWITKIGNPAAIKLSLDNKPVEVPVRRGFVTSDLYLKRNVQSAR